MKLVELLIALLIISVLAAFAVPSLRGYLERTDDTVLQSELRVLIQTAQQEARARSARIGFALSDQGRSFLLFLDPDKTQTLAIQRIKNGSLHLHSFPHRRDYLQFQSDGLRTDNGTIWYCPAKSESPAWKLMVSKTGQVHVIYPDAHGVLLDWQGVVLTCSPDETLFVSSGAPRVAKPLPG